MFSEYIQYLKDNPNGYWFKAKLFGWGWTPAKWQGWVVLTVFLSLIIANSYRIESISQNPDLVFQQFLPQTAVLILVLLLICYKTGEKPRWQWRIPDKYKKPPQNKL